VVWGLITSVCKLHSLALKKNTFVFAISLGVKHLTVCLPYLGLPLQ